MMGLAFGYGGPLQLHRKGILAKAPTLVAACRSEGSYNSWDKQSCHSRMLLFTNSGCQTWLSKSIKLEPPTKVGTHLSKNYVQNHGNKNFLYWSLAQTLHWYISARLLCSIYQYQQFSSETTMEARWLVYHPCTEGICTVAIKSLGDRIKRFESRSLLLFLAVIVTSYSTKWEP